MLKVKESGSFVKTETFLKANNNVNYKSILKRYGKEGVDLLRAATPKDTGVTADSWTYKIVETDLGISLEWHNSNTTDNIPVVILLVYGHGTQNGSYIEGVNFVNPALEPIFKSMATKLIREV